MRRSAFIFSAILAAAVTALAASVQTAKPEQTGFSSERLARIHDMVQRHIDAHDISGAVTLVARNGKVAHFEAHGLMDVDAKKPMSKDSLFWIMSMTKPVVGTAVLMMMEEGKLRLTDPVSQFIPEFKGGKVAVIQDRPAGAPAPAGSRSYGRSGPALSEPAFAGLIAMHVPPGSPLGSLPGAGPPAVMTRLVSGRDLGAGPVTRQLT